MILGIDVISDVVCPWCYIGKRRLAKAVAAMNGNHELRVRWHPFQLNPQIPKDGISRREYRVSKFGSWERSKELDAQVAAAGAAEGIAFAFERIERTPNTVDAHRLIWLAAERGAQDPVVEAIFSAYFTAGLDIGNRQTLIDVVASAGLDRQEADRVLNSDEGMDAFDAADKHVRRFRVHGVPFFIINDEIVVSGAQPPVSFLAAFNKALTPG